MLDGIMFFDIQYSFLALRYSMKPHKKVLILGYIWPELKSSAAGLRDWNLIETFVEANWDLTYVSPSSENSFSRKISDRNIPCFTFKANDSKFDQFISNQQPDFVIFDRFVIEEQFGWRVQENCPRACRILDTQDLHFLRKLRQQNLNSGASIKELSECQFDLNTEETYREISSIYRCDGTFLLSSFESRLLKGFFQIPGELLHINRFHYPELSPMSPGFESRSDFVMIGNFRHAPNTDGILWLKKEIWPLIRKKLPTARISIYGAYPTKEMMQLTHPSEGFLVQGPCEDQFRTLAKYRVNMAPLRFGAGIKGKITDGWWAGTPVVTTSIGAEGMFEKDQESFPWGGEIADTPEDIAERAVSLYQNSDHWKQAQNNGYKLIQKLYSAEENQKDLIQTLLKIEANQLQIRRCNFVGSMLNYHLHRSTKYFSKWIEAKNALIAQGPPSII
jgi:O-antigen biosynthesis protein